MGIDTLDPSQKGHRRFAYGSELVAVPTCCRVDVELVRTSILVNISSADDHLPECANIKDRLTLSGS